MRRSDAFSEIEYRKIGKIAEENTYYKSMNNWCATLRNSNKDYDRRSNYILHNSGPYPIYVHETCHLRDPEIIK